MEEILNRKYAQLLSMKKNCPTAILAKKIEPKILPTAILTKKYIETIKNKKYYLTAALAKIYFKYIGQKRGPSAMLAKG